MLLVNSNKSGLQSLIFYSMSTVIITPSDKNSEKIIGCLCPQKSMSSYLSQQFFVELRNYIFPVLEVIAMMGSWKVIPVITSPGMDSRSSLKTSNLKINLGIEIIILEELMVNFIAYDMAVFCSQEQFLIILTPRNDGNIFVFEFDLLISDDILYENFIICGVSYQSIIFIIIRRLNYLRFLRELEFFRFLLDVDWQIYLLKMLILHKENASFDA